MRLFLSVLLVLVTLNCFSQVQNVNFKKSTIYAEFLGQGIMGSINYDHLIKVNKSVKMSFSVGAIYAPNIKTFQLREKYPYTYNFGLPVSCNLMIVKKIVILI